MDFQQKIKELDYIHARIESERKALESRISQKKEF